MIQKWRRIFTAVLLLLLTDCTAVQAPSPAEQLALVDAKIAAGEYGNVNSLLVWHDGGLMLEAYYRGTDGSTMNQVYSVTKSITSAMIGKALQEGHITDVDEPVLPFFPEYEPVANLDGRKEMLTVEDLLTMRAGFAWDESSTIYGNDANDATRLAGSRDWTQYMLDREMAAEPGTTFTYNSGATLLLGGILAQTSGQTVEEYTVERLFEPLGITQWRWQETSTGQSNTGWGLYLRPIDMLKFGQLYLQQGRWQDAQIIPEAWVAQSTRPLVHVSDEFDYGYQWWRFADQNPVVADLAQNDLYFAWGFGGNFIFVIPHRNLIVVTTAENFEDGTRFFPALREYIFPIFE